MQICIVLKLVKTVYDKKKNMACIYNKYNITLYMCYTTNIILHMCYQYEIVKILLSSVVMIQGSIKIRKTNSYHMTYFITKRKLKHQQFHHYQQSMFLFFRAIHIFSFQGSVPSTIFVNFR